jgi:hypothetical protein
VNQIREDHWVVADLIGKSYCSPPKVGVRRCDVVWRNG